MDEPVENDGMFRMDDCVVDQDTGNLKCPEFEFPQKFSNNDDVPVDTERVDGANKKDVSLPDKKINLC